MTNLDTYRSTLEYREILRLLQKSTTQQENFLWQSHSLGKTIVPIQFIEIDFISREVQIVINSERYRIERDLPIYVKLEYRSSVFKVNDYRQNHNSIYFSFPELVKTQELRTFPRHTFRPLQDKYVVLRSSVNSLKDSGNELKVRAMDISHQGLGLIVSEQNRSFLKNNRILWVTGLQDDVLHDPTLAEVVYINSEVDSSFLIKKQKLLKVGLKLSCSFPEKIYNRFIK